MKFSFSQSGNKSSFLLAVSVFLFTCALLSLVQILADNPLLLAERFIPGAGWAEIMIIGIYGAFLARKMKDPAHTAQWRIISWTIFSVVFFSQLLFGLLFSEKFLMTGKLHLPVPAMILAGPVYRGQLSIMSLLFLSTVILTGPAWCSHLCYFGSFDGLLSRKNINRSKLRNKMPIKHIALLLFIAAAIILRLAGAGNTLTTILGTAVGAGGVIFALLLSQRKGKMMHCILYCPIGTLVSYLKLLNPFRLKIDTKCTFCGSCSNICRYDALSLSDLAKKKPGPTCTLCGDCLNACHSQAIQYQLFSLNPELSRNIYLFLTISVHSVFLALARI